MTPHLARTGDDNDPDDEEIESDAAQSHQRNLDSVNVAVRVVVDETGNEKNEDENGSD